MRDTDPDERDGDASGTSLTFGIEEEFLIVDARDGRPAPVNARLTEALGEGAGGAAEYTVELLATMMESAAGVFTRLEELRAFLAGDRKRLARAAADLGVRLVATGTPVIGPRAPRVVSDKRRYQDMRSLYGFLVSQQETCGCHVHVGVPDRETAVGVVNWLRPWLPTLLALSANSPFCDGVDTGYASWRTVALSRWPATAVPPYFASAAHYDEVTETLHRAGVLMRPLNPYWLARPSGRFPTVEVRAADVAATVDEAVLQAAVTRGLVRTAGAELAGGARAPEVDGGLLEAALWTAARYGLAGPGVHPMTGRQVPAAELAQEMLDRIRPALRELGDEEEVDRLAAAVFRTGTGADRQRASLRGAEVTAAAGDLLDEFDIGRT
ncbi:putative glutamate--cysteine ligase 2 [Microtetraspora sp. NBRC 13810]|uniref:carboxylate-amine ligase n=1 Tax=Microtetraspora sp. NBRC 13810 TaxID=3030990 RepID=UPI0024A44FCE|nr:glutamate--cysteine ligase [Microtetraspora sp. NBRC 13810]GLW09552.1 putative glutamate--cysteine ligase 2 [Microtetraspora sp. NBRC 13810]